MIEILTQKLKDKEFIEVSKFIAASVMERLSGLIITFIAVRLTTKAEFAEYGLVILGIQVLRSVIDFGQDTRLRVDLAKDKGNLSQKIISAFFISLIVFAVSIIFYLFLSNFYTINSFAKYGLLIVATVFFFQQFSFARNILISLKNINFYVYLTMAYIALDLIIFNALIFIFEADAIVARIFAMFLACSLISAHLFMKFFNLESFKKISFKADDIFFGGKMMIYSIALFGTFLAERFFLFEYNNPVFVAEIFFSLTIISPCVMIVDAVNKRYAPIFYEQINSGEHRLATVKVQQLSLIIFLICIFFSIFAPFFGILIGGEKYDTQSFRTLASLLAFFPLIKILSQFNGRYLVINKRSGVLAFNLWISGLFFLGMIFYFNEQISPSLYSLLHLAFYFMQFLCNFLSVQLLSSKEILKQK